MPDDEWKIEFKVSIIVAVIFITTFFLVYAPISIANAQVLTPEQRAVLETELKQVEAESILAQKQLSDAKAQSSSLSRDIAVLEAKIRAAQLDIKAKSLLIQTLGEDITVKKQYIDLLESRIDSNKETLADLLRKTNEVDHHSISELLLSKSTLSGFFNDIDTFQVVQKGLAKVFYELRADQASTTEEKNNLDARRNSTIDARHTIEVQQANIKIDQAEQKKLLAISKGNEKAYTSIVGAKETRAAQIRSALFDLSGAQSIPFGDAYNYAVSVQQKTGVAPAYLLAILTQETNLGKNVGTCYLTNATDGSGINARTQAVVSNVMKLSRDVSPFISITSSLGLDFKKMPVSCPQSIGFGGGMGPAQFIASTWMLMKDRIGQAQGVSTPNPWKPSDAFIAAGLYLADLGAGSTSYSAQRNAACRYYSGKSCGAVSGSNSYGNSVMALTDRIQRDQINPLLSL